MAGLMNHLEKNRKLDVLDKSIVQFVTSTSKSRVVTFAAQAHELIDLLANNRLNELFAMEDEDGQV